MPSELKPCPFCGAECGSYGLVHDDGCYISRLVRIMDEEDDTAYEGLSKAWNTRAERTCIMMPTTINNERFSDLVHEYECYECDGLSITYCDEEKPNYCPNCGARVTGD